MNVTSNRQTLGALNHVLYFLVSLLTVGWGVYAFVRAGDGSVSVEAARGEHRSSLRSKLSEEEFKSFPKSGFAEWVNREKGAAKVSLNDSADMIIDISKSSAPKLSSAKVDVEIVLPPDAPRLPSAPYGASTVRFKLLTSATQSPPLGN